MNVSTALKKYSNQLCQTSDSPRLDAEVLLAFVLHCNRTWLQAHPDVKVTTIQLRRFRRLVQHRHRSVPIPYLTGRCMFFDFELLVTPAVLVPRPFTELLVEAVWNGIPLNSQLTIADIGTGSGAIAMALAKHFPHANIIATDISSVALTVAKKNSIRLGLSRRISFRRVSLLDRIRPQPSIIIANLPYLTKRQLRESTIQHEPKVALDGGIRGLVFIRRLIHQAKHLPSIQSIGLEIDPRQSPTVRKLLKQWSTSVRISSISDGKNIRGVVAFK